MEVKSDLYVSFDVGYIKEEDLNKCIDQVEVVKIKINSIIGNVKNAMRNMNNNNKDSNIDFQ